MENFTTLNAFENNPFLIL